MPTPLLVDADLEFSATVDGVTLTGTLRGTGSDLELTVSEPGLLGGSGTGPARRLAQSLAMRGVSLRVTADRPLVTLGADSHSWWQRKVTGSRYIALDSIGVIPRLLRLRREGRRRPPLVPPRSPLPLAPTLLRQVRHVTTTHDPDRGGYPRLMMAPNPHPQPGERRPIYDLGQVTTIGSAPDSVIRLPDVPERLAVVRRDADDEFVVVSLDPSLPVRVNGAPVRQAILRTGSRVELGRWTLSYFREEYADHGRPHGGRIGGELGYQQPQPPRAAQ